jgi:WD40 repeat protein
MEEKQEEMNVFEGVKNREMKGSKAFISDWCSSSRSLMSIDECYELVGHKGCVNTINFDSSGEYLVSGSDDECVKIWNINTAKCLKTLKGHISNVFSTLFFKQNRDEVISGSNDADIRHYNIEKNFSTVYRHHVHKVLQLSINPINDFTFLSCSADGTARFFDTRVHYPNTLTQNDVEKRDTSTRTSHVLPQFFGGGRSENYDTRGDEQGSLLLDYNIIPASNSPILFAINFHPTDGNKFIVSSSCGDTRLFDMRKIEKNPNTSYINIYKSVSLHKDKKFEVSGCAFSRDGSEIVSTCLGDKIYLFDTETNFEKDYCYHTGRTIQQQNNNTNNKNNNNNSTSSTTNPVPLIDTKSTSSNNNNNTNNKGNNDNNDNNNDNNNNPNSNEIEINSFPRKSCAVCSSEGHLLRCSRCKNCWYCNKEHQRDHWPTHKLTCHVQPEKKEPVVEKPPSFKSKYEGHVSRRTIKGVNFYGPNSEYVITGSDDANIYIYNKSTAKLLRVLQGHNSVVNCITGHPSSPIIASSGIDKVVKIWNNKGEYPNQSEINKRNKIMADCVLDNASNPERVEGGNECLIQ